ncbi:hypothetical protein [Demequina aurantiaca]|uniref:hypothetical protein n=1 Tax=Demequina aurantiaca TaxID=676200 RepID=UPI003D340066
MTRTGVWVATVAATASLLFGSGLPAAASERDDTGESASLAEFRSDLAVDAARGDSEAKNSLYKFDNLSTDERSDLAAYFLGESPEDISPDAREISYLKGSTEIVEVGDFTWETLSPTATKLSQEPTVVAKAAISGSKSISNTSTFKFAGVTITKTKVSGSYEYTGGSATKTLTYACTVVQNYQPFSDISTTKNGSYVSGGTADFGCKVVVKRGVPTPWGTIAWSTKEAIQFVRGNGNGVTSSGWR